MINFATTASTLCSRPNTGFNQNRNIGVYGSQSSILGCTVPVAQDTLYYSLAKTGPGPLNSVSPFCEVEFMLAWSGSFSTT